MLEVCMISIKSVSDLQNNNELLLDAADESHVSLIKILLAELKKGEDSAAKAFPASEAELLCRSYADASGIRGNNRESGAGEAAQPGGRTANISVRRQRADHF